MDEDHFYDIPDQTPKREFNKVNGENQGVITNSKKPLQTSINFIWFTSQRRNLFNW